MFEPDQREELSEFFRAALPNGCSTMSAHAVASFLQTIGLDLEPLEAALLFDHDQQYDIDALVGVLEANLKTLTLLDSCISQKAFYLLDRGAKGFLDGSDMGRCFRAMGQDFSDAECHDMLCRMMKGEGKVYEADFMHLFSLIENQ